MKKHEIGSLVVVDGKKISGILTERDLVSKVFAGAVNPNELFVKNVMTAAPLVTVDPETDIQDAASVMSRNNVRHLPVIEKSDLVGILAIPNFYREDL